MIIHLNLYNNEYSNSNMHHKPNLISNLLEVSSKLPTIRISLYTDHCEGCTSLRSCDYPDAIHRHFELKGEDIPGKLFIRFGHDESSDDTTEVKIQHESNLHRKYIQQVFWTFFADQEVLLNKNFIDGLDVMVPLPAQHPDYKAYDTFHLKIIRNDWSALHLLQISYGGKTLIHQRSELELEEDLLASGRRFVFRKNIYTLKGLPADALYLRNEIYPVLTNDMKIKMGLPFNSRQGENVYLKQSQKINDFSNRWLRHEDLQQKLQLDCMAWVRVPEKKLFTISASSNRLLLGHPHNISVISPKYKLGLHGPFRLPSLKKVVFFVIFQEKERDYANELYKAFKNSPNNDMSQSGDSGHKSLYDFVRLKFEPDTGRSLKYSSLKHLLSELKQHLNNQLFDHEQYRYMAIYLSPIPSTSKSAEEKQVYYSMKELLLRYKISLQVIERDKLMRQEFRKYYIHNIAPAILAKLGGIPWQLERTYQQELIVGVGAYRNSINNTQYIGSAFSFNSNGTFRAFNCIAKSELFALAGDIREFIREHIQSFGNPERLVIHYYKTMSDKELKPISDMLRSFDLENIPIYIVSLTKNLSRDYILFDQNSNDLLPMSGTIARISRYQYLLFNNTRYESRSKVESYHYPLLLRISCSKPALLDKPENVKRLIDQVYQFSRIYWKSVKQQNLPVTVSYPVMLAEIYSHFEDDYLNEFARTNLWFL